MGWFRKWLRREPSMAYRRCPGCTYNIVTGGGKRSCNWYECPFLSDELKVFCPRCNYNFATGEGRPACEDPTTCEWAVAGYRHAEAARRALAQQH